MRVLESLVPAGASRSPQLHHNESGTGRSPARFLNPSIAAVRPGAFGVESSAKKEAHDGETCFWGRSDVFEEVKNGQIRAIPSSTRGATEVQGPPPDRDRSPGVLCAEGSLQNCPHRSNLPPSHRHRNQKVKNLSHFPYLQPPPLFISAAAGRNKNPAEQTAARCLVSPSRGRAVNQSRNSKQ